MKKKIKYLYEDPHVYDGYCATVYEDGTFELRDHWAVKRLPEAQRKALEERIKKLIGSDARIIPDTTANL